MPFVPLVPVTPFLSPDKTGRMTIYQTSGNPYGHIIMRGGKKPNYHASDVADAVDALKQLDLPEHLVIDFSHGNCEKFIVANLKLHAMSLNKLRMVHKLLLVLWQKAFYKRDHRKSQQIRC